MRLYVKSKTLKQTKYTHKLLKQLTKVMKLKSLIAAPKAKRKKNPLKRNKQTNKTKDPQRNVCCFGPDSANIDQHLCPAKKKKNQQKADDSLVTQVLLTSKNFDKFHS